jgi:hypothetical protein
MNNHVIKEAAFASRLIKILNVIVIIYIGWSAFSLWPDIFALLLRIVASCFAGIAIFYIAVSVVWLLRWKSTGDSQWPLLVLTPKAQLKETFSSSIGKDASKNENVSSQDSP